MGTAIFAKNGGFATLSVGLWHRDPNPRHSHRDFAGCWPKSSLALPGGGTGAEGEDGPRGRGDFRPPQQHLNCWGGTPAQGHHGHTEVTGRSTALPEVSPHIPAGSFGKLGLAAWSRGFAL